jgi:hypothetical protein
MCWRMRFIQGRAYIAYPEGLGSVYVEGKSLKLKFDLDLELG